MANENENEYREALFDELQVIARGVLTAIPSGAYEEEMLRWERVVDEKVFSGNIVRVTVTQTGGDAVTFEVEIRTSEGGTGDDLAYKVINITAEHDVAPPSPVAFDTRQTGNERGFIWVAIMPIGGTNGTYTVKIIAEPKR